MTGLERLRELVDDMGECSVFTVMKREWCERHGVTVIDGRMAMKDLLSEIVDQIERETAHDPSKDVSMSAYDLLPECDRKAISLALDCGGVEEIKKRLMPEGMEWPKVDGKPIDFKTGYEPSLGVLEAVSIYSNGACEVMSHDGIVKSAIEIHIAAPKVLDADGVEIREGDTVYSIGTGEPVTVYCVEGGNPWFGTTDGTIRRCSKFTHRAPVIAADGKPLLEGETVFTVNLGIEGVVERVERQESDTIVHVRFIGDNDCAMREPSDITHERDSWERLEDDADALLKAESNGKGSYNAANDYCNAHGLGTDGTVWVLVAQDLVRRAKKLAGVSE